MLTLSIVKSISFHIFISHFCRPRRLIIDIVKMKASLEPKREEWMAWKFMLLLLATLDEHQEMRKHDGNSKAHEANSGMGESFFQVPRDERKAKYEIHFGLLFQQTNYWSKQFLAAKLLRQSTRQALLSPALDLSAIGCLIFVCRSCMYIYTHNPHRV